MSRVIEMHYTAPELSTLLRKSDRWVRDRIKAGDFGPAVFFISGEYVVAAGGVNAYLDRCRVAVEPGTWAASEGELRRKLAVTRNE